jgi:hypothetical protein
VGARAHESCPELSVDIFPAQIHLHRPRNPAHRIRDAQRPIRFMHRVPEEGYPGQAQLLPREQGVLYDRHPLQPQVEIEHQHPIGACGMAQVARRVEQRTAVIRFAGPERVDESVDGL